MHTYIQYIHKKNIYEVLTVLARVACVLLLTATGEVRAVSERVLVTRAAILTRIAARSTHLRCTGQNRYCVLVSGRKPVQRAKHLEFDTTLRYTYKM